MPELPEVEYAARVARAACLGKVLASVRALHPSPRRALPDAESESLAGDRIVEVTRRGKHQLLRLATGRTLHVHFRMTGDWRVTRSSSIPDRFARVVFDFTDGTRLALDDLRALAVVTLHAAGIDPLPDLGPEATADAFNAAWLVRQCAGRRTPIKPALLDQRLVAGIGNIYASEALWYAKVDPTCRVDALAMQPLAAIAAGVKRALRKALDHPERYYGADGVRATARFNVYDREGRGCRRCGTAIVRIIQAARSTYVCPRCQA